MDCALITGGSKGIGRATALLLSKKLKLHILVNYSKDDEAAQECLDLIMEQGGSGEQLKFSVEEHSQVTAVLEEWTSNNPEKKITVLVNNAGITKDGLFLWMKPEAWTDVLSVSLNGFYNVTKFVLDGMLKHKYGRIINVSSISGTKGVQGQVNYSAAKAALIGATRSLATELAKMKITVNAVAPGFIDTDMLQDLDSSAIKKLVPMNRIGRPEEVAATIAFLASEDASYITGEVIHINGGMHS